MNYRFPTRSDELEAAAREELERILSDINYRSPPRRRKMLRYIAEETLTGRESALTAVPISQNVFGRNENFDHKSDPVVRIEARRLRRDLAAYYSEAGRKNPVRITIPKGHYVARFEWSDNLESDRTQEISPRPSPVKPGWPLRKIGFASAAISAVLVMFLASGFAYFWMRTDPPAAPGQSGPVVIVLPFNADVGAIDPALSGGITHEVVTNLLRFPGIRVVSTTEESLTAIKQRERSDAIYVLKGTIGADDTTVRIGTRLVRLADDNVIWSESYMRDMTVRNLLAIEAEIAKEITSRMGEMHGVINSDMLAGSNRFTPQLNGYLCVLRAYHYRRNLPGDALYQPVETCLKKTVAEDPEYAEAWAMLALMYNDEVRFRRVLPGEVAETYAKAEHAATLAIAKNPENANGWVALSAITHYQGNFEQSEEYARRAVEINPNDSETRALLAFRLITRGKFDEGIPMIQRAIAAGVNPPGWHYVMLAISHLINGDYDAMLDAALRSTIDESALSYSFVAMAYGMLGNSESAGQALKRMNEISPGYDPIKRLKVHQFTNETIEKAKIALNRAGWKAGKATRLSSG